MIKVRIAVTLIKIEERHGGSFKNLVIFYFFFWVAAV
jgi:hypothetical protein